MRSVLVWVVLVGAAQLAAPVPSHAGSPGPAPREATLHACAPGGGQCSGQGDAPCSDASSPCTCSVSGDPCLPLHVVAGPIAADLVLTVTDVPTCDSDPTVACGSAIPNCTISAGTMSSFDVLLEGRLQKKAPRHGRGRSGHGGSGRGGKSFTIEQVFGACDPALGVGACSPANGIFCSNVGQRMTESLLGQTFGRDLGWWPLPRALGRALAKKLHVRSGTPYIASVSARTEEHDGTGDGSPTVVRFSVEIEFVR